MTIMRQIHSTSAVLQAQHPNNTPSASNRLFKSPRPTPKFLPEENTFSQKKFRSGYCNRRDSAVPRPPIKSAPPLSRLFPNKSREEEFRPREVSFRKATSDNTLLRSPVYDERRRDLYVDQCFTIEKKLGEGSFGEVFKVRSVEDNSVYAVKRSRGRFRGEADKRRRLEEVNKHESLSKHPNCVEFHKAWAEKGHLYIQTELCKMSLQEFAEKNHDIPESTVWDFLVDLLQGLRHLHNQNFLHLDIKPDNIFCSFYDVCKLGDFGLTVELNKIEVSEAQEGDPQYLAPELLEGKFGKHADVFSLGISMLEIACDLELPRNGTLWHQLRQADIPPDITEGLSNDLREVLLLMMHPDYQQRPTVDELLSMSVLRRRQRLRWCKIAVKKVWSSIAVVFSVLFVLLARLWCFLIPASKPSEVMKSPEFQKDSQYRRPSDWDLSFSDDDCFEKESDASNLSNHSLLGAPLSYSSSEDESMRQFNQSRSSIASPSPRKTLFPRTHHSALRINPRSSSPKSCSRIRLSLDTESPNKSGMSDFSRTPTKSHNTPMQDLDDEDDDEMETGSVNLHPKNLMDMFHDIEEDL